jgi:AraC-like DNA-binding protein
MANGMVIILRGEAHYRIDGRDYHVRAGDVVYTRPGMEREATTTGMLCAAFDFDLSKGCIDLPIISRHSGTEELERLIREYQYEWLGKAPGFKLKCAGIFLQLLHELQYGGETRANYHVEKIKRYIVDHYAKPIRVESIAAMSGLSTVYCGALFRRTQGMTIIQFANLIRVQRAASILEEEVYSIGEVAYMCGFSDVYYFSRTFKKIMGISPSRWGHLHPMTGIPKAT